MATLLRMTEVAANATHATLAAWSKQPGDAFAAGDALAAWSKSAPTARA